MNLILYPIYIYNVMTDVFVIKRSIVLLAGLTALAFADLFDIGNH